eukprot:CAMPEP_0175970436 /NCGR_PEP_ID=MMETSP0108-20121206/41054_1 /TAXON_ID=195067 ORGANISM="Goniomonas pacifica, Strain CCMP1869" /NCGR_SAMPLE_ID=MMETSP0108 /ASSEMBLY_ACC=CAM_ASM_000204 /LENGTH=108 /DNA_ID=CAMNT_0017299405 /DNA_START=70 /DNA_END=392 /DNA_ORIENTATION=-
MSMGSEVEAAVVGVASAQQAALEETMVKYRKEVAERKKLHNDLLDLRGAIRVFCRVRPLSGNETKAGRHSAVTCPDENNVVVGDNKFFTFDQVFGPGSSQEQVYKETA